MNNQPLPKPSQTQKSDDSSKSKGASAPPPSALNNSVKPMPADKSTVDSKQGVVFDGDSAKTRIPLSQKTDDKAKKTDGEVKLPPTSLSALSSMSSNIIPTTSSKDKLIKPVQAIKMPEKTVLGRPIPQAMRGEELPKGLGSTSPSSPATSPVPSPRIMEEKSSPVPRVSKDSSASKTEKSSDPKFATEKKSALKFLPFIVGGAIILVIIGVIISKIFGGGESTSLPKQDAAPNANVPAKTETRTEIPAERTEIVYWGLWESNEVMDGIVADFEAANPGVKINYVKQSHKDYRERLQTALDTQGGPDVFRFHASWAPMLKSALAPIPSNIVSSKEFQDNYYPIVTDQLVVGGQYIGVPLMYEGLALYYNEEILESADEIPPETWAELRVLASKLTVKSANGIERAGLAIGNTANVDHFSDILATLMLQNGASFSDPNSQETKDALLFYTNFVLKDEVWNDTLPSSTTAFARGDVAMMFAPSWRAHEISAQNPDLRFKTMTLPQLSDERITWGSYWAEGINTNSESKGVAGEFLGFLSSDENLMKLFSKASETRAFGEIYPKASMAEKLIDNEIVASYLDDAIYAQSWYLSSFTHDNGINDQMIGYYEDGINAVLAGEDIDEILLTIEDGTKQILKQYGISSK